MQSIQWVTMLGLALGMLGCVSRINVARVTKPADQPPGFVMEAGAKELMAKGGVYYALPRTRVAVELAVERTEFTPGKFADYAATCLGPLAGKIRKEPELSFELLEPKVTTENEPDPGQVFVMDIRGRYFEDKSIKAAFGAAGTLSSLEAVSDDHSVEVALEAMNAAAGLAGKAMLFGAAAGKKEEGEEGAEKKPEELACDEYRSLQKKRASALGSTLGGVPLETLNRVLAEFDQALAALRQGYFVGREKKKTFVRRFEDLPVKGEPVKLLRFSEEAGVCEVAVAMQGNPFPEEAKALKGADEKPICGCLATPEEIRTCRGKEGDAAVAPWVMLEYRRPAGSMAQVLEGVKENGQRGLYYRVPERVHAAVSWGKEDLAAGELEIAQMGGVVSLPNSTGGRKTAYTAEFTPAGGLKNFQVNSTALLDKSSVQALGGAAGKALDAKAASSDQTAAIKRETDLIKAKKDLLDAQRALEEAQGGASKSTPPQ